MHIEFCDRNIELVNRFVKMIITSGKVVDLGVSAHVGNPLDQVCDAVVSPANSFGFMDGGIDYLYTQRFGPGLQKSIQTFIKDRGQEILVGEAFVFPTNDSKIPFCISAPTMRVPRVITDYMDVFLATRAAIMAAQKYGFKTVAIPGMGTGVGKVPYDRAAKAMFNGMQAAMLPFHFPVSWMDAQDRHDDLRG